MNDDQTLRDFVANTPDRMARRRMTTTGAVCRRHQGEQKRSDLQRALLPHEGPATRHHPLHPS